MWIYCEIEMIGVPEFVQSASEIAKSPFVFAILFILLLAIVIWVFLKNKQELLDIMKRSEDRADERENKLHEQLGIYNESLKEMSGTMSYMNNSMVKMEHNMSEMNRKFERFEDKTNKEFGDIWEEVKRKDE